MSHPVEDEINAYQSLDVLVAFVSGAGGDGGGCHFYIMRYDVLDCIKLCEYNSGGETK